MQRLLQLWHWIPIFCRKPDDDRIILNTLPISHYVEKVRWCLDKSGLNYEEEKDVGIMGIIMTGRTVPTFKIPKHDISISNSSDILKYIYGHLLTQDEDRAKFLQPSPKSRELEAEIDRMGYNIRTYLYYHVSIYIGYNYLNIKKVLYIAFFLYNNKNLK